MAHRTAHDQSFTLVSLLLKKKKKKVRQILTAPLCTRRSRWQREAQLWGSESK